MDRFIGRDFISLKDYSREELFFYLHTARQMKMRKGRGYYSSILHDRNLAMVFQKPSLRTRVSFQVGMNQLGGSALYISPQEIGLGKRESIKDVARVLSRMVDGVMARVFEHEHLLELAENATVPIINGLSDLLHPCQGLADYLTMQEIFSDLCGLRIAYVGDGNNVCHSLMYGAERFGASMTIACPKGYEPDKGVTRDVSGADIEITHSPEDAVSGAQVIYTDTWASMGQEDEHAARLKDFEGFQVNKGLLSHADPAHVVMHCLPAHRNEEITDSVIDGDHSAVYIQAENRLHAQKAVLALNL